MWKLKLIRSIFMLLYSKKNIFLSDQKHFRSHSTAKCTTKLLTRPKNISFMLPFIFNQWVSSRKFSLPADTRKFFGHIANEQFYF